MAERLLLFRYGEDVLGVPAQLTREVVELNSVVPVPGGQGGVAGLVIVSGQSVPLLDLQALAGLPKHASSLGLSVDIGGEGLVFPLDEVVGNIDPDEPLMTPDMISPPRDPGDYRLDFEIRVINPAVLLATLQARLAPV